MTPDVSGEELDHDEVASAERDGKDPTRTEEALRTLRELVRRHEDVERPRAARALVAAGELEERLGRRDGALALYARVGALFPERRAEVELACRRARALREGGGLFLHELLARGAAARGRERLAKLSSLRVEGAVVMGERKVPFTLLGTRSPLRVRQDAPELEFSCAWNGDAGWRRTRKDGVVFLSGPRLDDLVSWARGSWRELTAGAQGVPRLVGPVVAGGRDGHRVEWRDDPASPPWTVDLAESGLPLRATGLSLGLEGEPVPMTLHYGSWREVEGARFAGRVDYYKGKELAYSFLYERIELDPAIEAVAFDPPR